MSIIRTIWSLNFQHEFYKDGRSRDFSVKPTFTTQKMLDGKRWQYRTDDDSLDLVSSDATPQIEKSLHFSVYVKNTDFFHFTDINPENGKIFWFGCDNDVVQTEQLRLVGRRFSYQYKHTDHKILLVIHDTTGTEVLRSQGVYTGGFLEFKPELPVSKTGRFIVKVLKGKRTLSEEQIFVDSDLSSRRVFGVIELLPQRFESQINLKVPFESKKESWRFYFISKTENEDVLVLKDESKPVEGNRYSTTGFKLCERPVENNLGGSEVSCFETGYLDKDQKFIPQLIPAFEENKRSLTLYRYSKAIHKVQPPQKYKYKRSRRSSRDDDDDDEREDYFNYRCIERKYWDRRLKKHLIPKRKKIYIDYWLRKKGTKVIEDVQNPSMRQIKKEVYIYI